MYKGQLLTRVREIVGPSVVIGAELDPHTHLTDTMVRQATLLMAFREYPHTDAVERGLELVRACVAAARGQLRPVPAVFDCQTIGVVRSPVEPARSCVAVSFHPSTLHTILSLWLRLSGGTLLHTVCP